MGMLEKKKRRKKREKKERAKSDYSSSSLVVARRILELGIGKSANKGVFAGRNAFFFVA